MIDLPPPTYERTIEAIVRCDIPRGNIQIKYEDYLQSDEVTITDLGEVSEAKLRCLKNAVHPFYVLTIEDETQRAAFYEFSEREDRPRQRAEAQDWLRSQGLLDRLPSFDRNQGISEFAKSLERSCGLREGSALLAYGASSLTLLPEFHASDDLEMSAKALHCLLRMFAASDASEHGIRFGFIGNEAIHEGDEG